MASASDKKGITFKAVEDEIEKELSYGLEDENAQKRSKFENNGKTNCDIFKSNNENNPSNEKDVKYQGNIETESKFHSVFMYKHDKDEKTALNDEICTARGVVDENERSEQTCNSVDVHSDATKSTETEASYSVDEVDIHARNFREGDGCSTNQRFGNSFTVETAMTDKLEDSDATIKTETRLVSNIELETPEVVRDLKPEDDKKENFNENHTTVVDRNGNKNLESVSNSLIVDKSIIHTVGCVKKPSANETDTTNESSLSKILNQDDSTKELLYEKQGHHEHFKSSHKAFDTPISIDTICQARELIEDETIGSDFDDKSVKQTRVVLIGITGSGKSATGNTLLGKKAFKTSVISTSVTARCEHGTRKFDDRYLKVVDTPGLYDTEMSEEEVKRELARCILLLSPGPHAFLIIMKVGRFNQQEKNTVDTLVTLFGDDNFLNYSIIIITRKDELEEDGVTLEEYIQRAPFALKQILDQCGNRCFAVNNKLNEEEKTKQTKELLSCIDEMVEKDGRSYYSHALFEKVEKERQIRIEEEKKRLEEVQMMKDERQRKEEDVRRKEVEVTEREHQLELETLRKEMEWKEKQEKLRIQKQEYENERLRKELELKRERDRMEREHIEMERRKERKWEKRERERERERERNLMEQNKNNGSNCIIM